MNVTSYRSRLRPCPHEPRHFSTTRYRPLVWRNTHPYVVCDRWEDATPRRDEDAAGSAPSAEAEDGGDGPHATRAIALYGYVRGTHLKPNMKARASRAFFAPSAVYFQLGGGVRARLLSGGAGTHPRRGSPRVGL